MTENYDTDLARIVTLKSGKLGIETPYNASFVKELKASVPSSSWSRPYWTIAPSGEDQAIDFKVIEQDLDSGGSRKNPGLFGKLVIEASVRPEAVVSPKAEIEIIEAGEKPNPLADFSTEELLAELKRRGE